MHAMAPRYTLLSLLLLSLLLLLLLLLSCSSSCSVASTPSTFAVSQKYKPVLLTFALCPAAICGPFSMAIAWSCHASLNAPHASGTRHTPAGAHNIATL